MIIWYEEHEQLGLGACDQLNEREETMSVWGAIGDTAANIRVCRIGLVEWDMFSM